MIDAFLTGALVAVFVGFSPAKPVGEEGGAQAELRAALQTRLDEYVADGRPPGVSAGIVLEDGTRFALAAGLADRARKTPLTPKDRLCGGSSGKTYVAAVVLQLVQEQKLRIEDLAGDTLGSEPWFERLPNASELTLENLLQHRSGLERHEFMPAFMQEVLANPDRVWKPEELLAFLLDRKPLFPAGDGFAYSDSNYIVLGMIVERVTGKTLHEEVQRRLLGPLELTGVAPQDSRTIPGLVRGYAGEKNPFQLPDELFDGEGRFLVNPQFEWAGGGYVGTGGDLARWAVALYTGPVLSEELRARMVDGREASELGPGMRYGLGCEVWPTEHGPAWGHAGFFPGYLTEMRYWPELGISVAVQVNTSEYAALGAPLGALCEGLLAIALEHEATPVSGAR